jgi:hypothetical protein
LDPVRVAKELDPVRVAIELDPVRVAKELDPVRVAQELDPVRVACKNVALILIGIRPNHAKRRIPPPSPAVAGL